MNLPKVYEPDQYEGDIYALWEKSGAFAPQARGHKDTYSLVMPPPNANANLHMGQELTFVLEDISVRYHRMLGRATLMIPGADHAGFESWVVYEKKLNKEGKTRFDFSREELYQQVWDFVEANKTNIGTQIRAMGVSCDWDKFTYTLDEKVVNTAYGAFKKMWEEGLIYRGERLVNFCTFHGTSFSDIEVVYKDVPGYLWHIKYPLTDGSGELIVATTRPETMLGDTAVAVHPDDERYKAMVGKTIKLPLTQREIPIITDAMVDREFGTGAVKITPAHDPNDFEVAGRHDLPFITVIDHEGKLNHNAPEAYRGKTVDEARKVVVDDLVGLGLLDRTEDNPHSVGHCYKCGTVIQPLLRDQWFVNMKPLASKAIKALRDDKITFYPESKKEQCIAYLKNIRDWNISRQIAWGIPIPAFQNVDDPEDWVYNEQVSEEVITIDTKTYRRDPDVFDTWFSSGQWPYITLGFPDGKDFKDFYPLSLMETGGEILYQWVCRMIMLGLYVAGDVPFKAVYVHGYVMAEDGSKMSKSIGNVVDPMPVIEKYGSDALRMGIIAGRAPAVNRGYDSRRVEEARNFCNKIWNVARYIEGAVPNFAQTAKSPHPKTEADHWILSKLQHSTREIGGFLDEYRFSEAYEAIYHLLWDDFADWYIEASKVNKNDGVLAYGLQTILKLAHPFAPFVTETIWQTLHPDEDSLLITASWPDVPKADTKKVQDFELLQALVKEIRFIDNVIHLKNVTLYHSGEAFLTAHADAIKKLSRVAAIKEVSDGTGLHLTTGDLKCWLDVDSQSAQSFLKKLAVQKDQQAKAVAQLEARLANKSYVDNAPKEIVAQTKAQLEEAKQQLQKVTTEYDRFAPKA